MNSSEDLKISMKSQRLLLRELSPDDVTEKYVNWLNDPEINRFLESRFTRQTKEGVSQFVRSIRDSENDFLFGIFLSDSEIHIGNIRLGPIDQWHKRATIGLLIGDKPQWGKGYATEAIDTVAQFAFQKLKLNKVFCGYYASNLGSHHAFHKAGFRIEARLRDHWLSDGMWVEGVMACRINYEML